MHVKLYHFYTMRENEGLDNTRCLETGLAVHHKLTS